MPQWTRWIKRCAASVFCCRLKLRHLVRSTNQSIYSALNSLSLCAVCRQFLWNIASATRAWNKCAVLYLWPVTCNKNETIQPKAGEWTEKKQQQQPKQKRQPARHKNACRHNFASTDFSKFSLLLLSLACGARCLPMHFSHYYPKCAPLTEWIVLNLYFSLSRCFPSFFAPLPEHVWCVFKLISNE